MPSILLAEDDAGIADPLARVLRREGHDVEIVADGLQAFERSQTEAFDLLVLDLGLPLMDGIEVCRQLRKLGNPIPILMLTARAEEIEKVAGLDVGADDYVTKPFGVAELLARVRSLLRRQTDTRVASDVTIDLDSRRAWKGPQELALTLKEFDLLALLVEEAGRVVTRQRIMEEVWDENWFGSTKTLDMHVSSLRRKLGDDPTEPHLLTTIRGVGYRFETA
jgi:DNA-binding response OmpR family regulator